jgi:phage-related protein
LASRDAAVPFLVQGLWEIRSDLPGNRIARVFFRFTEGRLVASRGLIKKTQKTPEADLKLARKRKREFKSEEAI